MNFTIEQWREAKTDGSYQALMVKAEELARELCGRWQRQSEDVFGGLEGDAAVRALAAVLGQMPEVFRPDTLNPMFVLLWATMLVGRLGQRALVGNQ